MQSTVTHIFYDDGLEFAIEENFLEKKYTQLQGATFTKNLHTDVKAWKFVFRASSENLKKEWIAQIFYWISICKGIPVAPGYGAHQKDLVHLQNTTSYVRQRSTDALVSMPRSKIQPQQSQSYLMALQLSPTGSKLNLLHPPSHTPAIDEADDGDILDPKSGAKTRENSLIASLISPTKIPIPKSPGHSKPPLSKSRSDLPGRFVAAFAGFKREQLIPSSSAKAQREMPQDISLHSSAPCSEHKDDDVSLDNLAEDCLNDKFLMAPLQKSVSHESFFDDLQSDSSHPSTLWGEFYLRSKLLPVLLLDEPDATTESKETEVMSCEIDHEEENVVEEKEEQEEEEQEEDNTNEIEEKTMVEVAPEHVVGKNDDRCTTLEKKEVPLSQQKRKESMGSFILHNWNSVLPCFQEKIVGDGSGEIDQSSSALSRIRELRDKTELNPETDLRNQSRRFSILHQQLRRNTESTLLDSPNKTSHLQSLQKKNAATQRDALLIAQRSFDDIYFFRNVPNRDPPKILPSLPKQDYQNFRKPSLNDKTNHENLEKTHSPDVEPLLSFPPLENLDENNDDGNAILKYCREPNEGHRRAPCSNSLSNASLFRSSSQPSPTLESPVCTQEEEEIEEGSVDDMVSEPTPFSALNWLHVYLLVQFRDSLTRHQTTDDL